VNTPVEFLKVQYGTSFYSRKRPKHRKALYHVIDRIKWVSNNYEHSYFIVLSPYDFAGVKFSYNINSGSLFLTDKVIFLTPSPSASTEYSVQFPTVREVLKYDIIFSCEFIARLLKKLTLISLRELVRPIKILRSSDPTDKNRQKGNPFIALNSEVLIQPQEFIINIAAERLNISRLTMVTLHHNSIPFVRPTVNPIAKRYRYELLRTENVVFITCYSFDPYISFRFYWQAFDAKIWIGILAFFMILSLSLFLFLSKRKLVSNFCAPLFYFRFLVDEPVSIARQLENCLPFNFLTMPWIGLSVIFTCLYTSSLITYLNTPVNRNRLEHPNQTLCDLENSKPSLVKEERNFRISDYVETALKIRLKKYNKTIPDWAAQGFHNGLTDFIQNIKAQKHKTPPHKKNDENWTLPLSEYELDSYFREWQKDENCFDLLSTPVRLSNTTLISDPKKYFLISTSITRLMLSTSFVIRRKHRYTPKLDKLQETEQFAKKLNINYGGFVIESLIEEQLTQCGKTVFVGERPLILRELEYLNVNYKTKMYVVNEPYFVARTGIAYDKALEPKFQTYIKAVVQSGIYTRMLHTYNNYRYYIRKFYTSQKSNAKNLESVDKVRISGSIQTLFYLSLILLIVCGLILLVEIKTCYFGKFSQFVQSVCTLSILEAYYRIQIGFSRLWRKRYILFLIRKFMEFLGRIRTGIAFKCCRFHCKFR